jgi:actin-related protein
MFPVFEKQADIPKGFVDDYEERDGKWHPKVDDGAELKKALKDERKERDAERKALEKKVADLETKQKAEKAGITDEQLKKLRDDVRSELEAEYKPKLEKAETVERENRALKLDHQVQRMAAEAGFLPEKLGDLWKLHGEDFDLTDDGKPMVKGKPGIDPKKHIETLKKARPEWVQGTKADGGGAAGQQKKDGASGTLAEDVIKNPAAALQAAHAANVKQ